MNTSGDWRESLAAARFEEAHRRFLMSPDAGTDASSRRALEALADLQQFVRDKAWGRAQRRLERIDEKPPLLDWTALASELELLAEGARRLERLEPDEALELLAAGEVRFFPAELANQQGTARVYAGEIDEAKREFLASIELDPRHYRAHTNLGNAWLESGDVDAAIACYERALAVNDEFANAHHNLGVAYRRRGDVGRSVRQLRRAQRAQQQSEKEHARERLSESGGGTGLKALRWLLYAALAAVVLAILKNRGLI
jgi:tetratricopeptide (TPR) repeat protein